MVRPRALARVRGTRATSRGFVRCLFLGRFVMNPLGLVLGRRRVGALRTLLLRVVHRRAHPVWAPLEVDRLGLASRLARFSRRKEERKGARARVKLLEPPRRKVAREIDRVPSAPGRGDLDSRWWHPWGVPPFAVRRWYVHLGAAPFLLLSSSSGGRDAVPSLPPWSTSIGRPSWTGSSSHRCARQAFGRRGGDWLWQAHV